MVVEELITLLGFKADVSDADKATAATNLFINAAKLAAGAAVAAGVAVAGMVLHVAELADQTAKTSDKLGIAAEALQELSFGFELSGVEDATTAFRTFAKATEDAQNASGEALPYIQKMGISASEFAGLSLDARLDLVAANFSKIPAGAQRAAAAQALFGRSGLDMIPFLNEGPEGIADLRKEFNDLSRALTRDELAQFEVLNDNISRLQRFVSGLAEQASLKLIPALNEIGDAAVAWVKANRDIILQKVDRLFRNLAEFIREAARSFVAFVDWTQRTIEALGGLDRILAVLKVTLLFFTALLGVQMVTATIAWVAALSKAALALDLVKIKAILAQAAVFAIPVAIAALITAIALVIEDLYAWSQGQDSLTGELLAGSETFKAFVDLMSLSEDTLDSIEAWFTSSAETIGNWIDTVAEAGAAVGRFLGFGGEELAVGVGGPGDLSAAGAGNVAAGAAGTVSNQSTSAVFNMGGNQFSFGGAGGTGAPVADLNRALADRERAQAEEYRRALQTLGTGEQY